MYAIVVGIAADRRQREATRESVKVGRYQVYSCWNVVISKDQIVATVEGDAATSRESILIAEDHTHTHSAWC